MDEFQYYISVPEAAKQAGVARNTMRLAAQHGHIKAFKPARNWLIDSRDIDRWKTENYQPNMRRQNVDEEDTDDDT